MVTYSDNFAEKALGIADASVKRVMMEQTSGKPDQ